MVQRIIGPPSAKPNSSDSAPTGRLRLSISPTRFPSSATGPYLLTTLLLPHLLKHENPRMVGVGPRPERTRGAVQRQGWPRLCPRPVSPSRVRPPSDYDDLGRHADGEAECRGPGAGRAGAL